MKKMFPGYYLPSEEDFESLWKDGLFVFDTNVLLDMYSYPDAVRDVFESVLRKIQDRIWIPFFVGLEFQQNRFKRVLQSEKNIKSLLDKIQNTAKELSDEVESIELEKRAVGLEDVQERLKAVRDSHLSLSEAVELVYKKVPLVSLDDDIANKIYDLFEGRIGSAVENQDKLDKMLVGADERYVNSIPPGFRDSKKDGSVFWGGVVYPQKYGDFIIWKQVIDHVLNSGNKKVVFVTGDRKEDWWFKVEGKTLGPHPLLVEEIFRIGKVDVFWMYSSDQFLEYAERYLRATEVTKETIDQVKELASGGSDLLGDEPRHVNVCFDVLEDKNVADSYKTFMEHLEGVARRESAASSSSSGNYYGIVEGNVKNLGKILDFVVYKFNCEYCLGGVDCFDFIGVTGNARLGLVIKDVSAEKNWFKKVVDGYWLSRYSAATGGVVDDFAVILLVPSEVIYEASSFSWRKMVDQSLKSFVLKYKPRAVVVGVFVGGEFKEIISVCP
ncbi:PIN-like domain-containing protein [Solidesulfovibrio magneticus]|uniref:PIN like domain-containing protein n=1 Tax=Solidesulfovibrio magneticus (strain ATCC 700980 / DSM 13731 / RS-1) TaxID=573370 RepID=C4XIZ2_SOLM1|nr:PIN-like domain-containing protein [Solidesulfovibrio magneticus]BAH74156.1 hypothetical protein DMR_06650 [Solidesulfovibrio magneticus RS-1]